MKILPNILEFCSVLKIISQLPIDEWMGQGIKKRLSNSLGSNVAVIINWVDLNDDAGTIGDFFFNPTVRKMKVTKVSSHMGDSRGIYACISNIIN